VSVDADTGEEVDVSDSVPGATPDITLLDQSGVLDDLPVWAAIGAIAALITSCSIVVERAEE
jgi:hypothetical protein